MSEIGSFPTVQSQPQTTPTPKPKTKILPTLRGQRRIQAVAGYIFILPWVIGFLVFKLAPIVASFIISLTNFYMLEPSQAKFIGLTNYINITRDELAASSLTSSLLFAFFSILLQVGFAIGIAAILTSARLRARPVLRSLFFLPSIIPSIAVIFMWRGFLSSNGDIINPILASLNIPELGNLRRFSSFADGTLMRSIQALWGIGPGFLIMYGALQSVPQELYESAKIDGAGPVRRFFSVTLPLASPAIFFSFIINLVVSFGGVALMDRGTTYSSGLSPYDDYISTAMFTYFKVGYASSLAWLFFGIIFLVTALLFWSSKHWVYFPEGH
jgi:ABC-type sugar transport system permease subunit